MNYEELKAAELRALCEERGIKPSRARVDMIEDLKARDAADELTRISQELNLPDEPLPVSEKVPAPEPQAEPEKPAESRPVVTLDLAHYIEDGVFFMTFLRGPILEQAEHEVNLRKVFGEALAADYDVYGPPFRDHSRSTDTHWTYGINVRRP